MNGVKEKFKTEEVSKLMDKMDLIIIMETHFGIRTRCPEGFEIICRSKEVESKRPGGGVALYKKKTFTMQIGVMVNCELRVTSCELRVELLNCELRVIGQ